VYARTMSETHLDPNEDAECPDAGAVVVLVHGLWVNGWSWMAQRMHLQREGFSCELFSYPSVQAPLHKNAAALAAFVAAIDAPVVHLLGHSLGNALIWRALTDYPESRPGRVVMVAPPFLDSLPARRFSTFAAGHAVLGKTMEEWLATTQKRWDVPRELGIIAGNLAFGLGMIVAPELPHPHDGVVAVSETQVPGAKDHIQLPVSHTGMLIAPSVARQAAHFLRRGRFSRSP
jgi:pimeloyl-ACP methyl ester carboxylesterase